MTGGWTKGECSLDNFPDYVDGTDMEVLDSDGFPIATVEASPILNRWGERFPKMCHWADGADSGKTQRHRNQSELLANATLITEAFNVANETGLTPRQLVDQRAELLAACEAAFDFLGGVDDAGDIRGKLLCAIAKCTGAA